MISSVLFGICIFFVTTGLGLLFIFITDQPFLHDITALNLVSETGYSREVIIENYSAVMDYLSPFFKGEFSLPSMKYSESGASHFADCKPLFNAFFILALLGLIVCILLVIKNKKSLNFKVSAVSTVAIPAVILAAMAVSFDKAFVLFHKLFFSNMDWQFDPVTDEIINILPEEFFLHCALVIAVFWVIGAVIELLVHIKTRSISLKN